MFSPVPGLYTLSRASLASQRPVMSFEGVVAQCGNMWTGVACPSVLFQSCAARRPIYATDVRVLLLSPGVLVQRGVHRHDRYPNAVNRPRPGVYHTCTPYSRERCVGNWDCQVSQSNVNFQYYLKLVGKFQCLNFQELISKAIVSTVPTSCFPTGGWLMAAGPVSHLGSFEPGDKTGLRLSPHLAPCTRTSRTPRKPNWLTECAARAMLSRSWRVGVSGREGPAFDE